MKIHIVQKGDTLWKIANKYNVDFEELKKMNTQLSDPDKLMPGMKIKVPTGGVPVKKEKPKAPNKPMFPNGEMNTSPKMNPVNQSPKPTPKQNNSPPQTKKQESNMAPKQENATMPETAWSFHHPPMDDGPKHFLPANEMPKSESDYLQPMFPPSSGFYGPNYAMPNMPQSPQQNADNMSNSMNAKPYSTESMPQTQVPPQAGQGMYPTHGPIDQENQMPSFESMPPMTPNSMPMPASPCDCGSESYPSPMEKEEWHQKMLANWNSFGPMPQNPNSAWKSDSGEKGMMPPNSGYHTKD